MSYAEPSFGTLDLGQPGSTRFAAGDATAAVRVVFTEPGVAAGEFAFPGLDGLYRAVQGVRGQTIVWHCAILAEESDLALIEHDILDLVRAGTPAQMSVQGQIRSQVVLARYVPEGDRPRIDPDPGRLLQCSLIFVDLNV